MRNVECGIDIPASSLELSFSFRIPNSTLRISPEADRMLLFLTVTSLALQAPVADTSPFRALPLPAANRVRNASGAPGPDYWQQRADYVRSEERRVGKEGRCGWSGDDEERSRC